MKTKLFSIVISAFLFATVGLAQRGLAVLNGWNSIDLYRINDIEDNGQIDTTILGILPFPIRGLSHTPFGYYYAIDSNEHLITIDETNGATNTIISVPLPDAHDVAYNHITGEVYVVAADYNNTQTRLYRVDFTTPIMPSYILLGTWGSQSAPIVLTVIYGIDFSPWGELYAWNDGVGFNMATNGGLNKFDLSVSPPELIDINPNQGAGFGFQQLSFDDEGRLWIGHWDMYTVNINTGTWTHQYQVPQYWYPPYLSVYDLETNVAGTPLCTTNSPGVIEYYGQTSLNGDMATLVATNIPYTRPVMFFAGMQQTYVPGVGNGPNALCIGWPFGRWQTVFVADTDNKAYLRLDLNIADTMGWGQWVFPTQTWYFQAWYEDGGGIPGNSFYNFTNSTKVQFQ